MTMHLVRGLTTAGRRSGKQKWASAEQKRRAQELEQEWNSLQDRWKPNKIASSKTAVTKIPTYTHRDSSKSKIPSVDSNIQGAVTVNKTPQYTGGEILGITVIHKSCLQPVFSKQEAIDAAKMRR